MMNNDKEIIKIALPILAGEIGSEKLMLGEVDPKRR